MDAAVAAIAEESRQGRATVRAQVEYARPADVAGILLIARPWRTCDLALRRRLRSNAALAVAVELAAWADPITALQAHRPHRQLAASPAIGFIRLFVVVGIDGTAPLVADRRGGAFSNSFE